MQEFILTDEEVKKVKEWNKTHRCSLRTFQSAIGGELTFSFIPTGLGEIKIVKCVCGSKLNLTNSENW